MATYQFERWAFKHAGRCTVCDERTRSGIRADGRMRFTRVCERCCEERVAVEITSWWSDGNPITRRAR